MWTLKASIRYKIAALVESATFLPPVTASSEYLPTTYSERTLEDTTSGCWLKNSFSKCVVTNQDSQMFVKENQISKLQTRNKNSFYL